MTSVTLIGDSIRMGYQEHVARELQGAAQVWGAILVSALTTVVVFIPILIMELEAGQLFRDIAVAISVSVMASLVVAMTVIPALSSRLLVARQARLDVAALPGIDHLGRGFSRLVRRYARTTIANRLVGLLAVGTMVPVAVEARDRLSERGVAGTVVNCRFVKPMDVELLRQVRESCRVLVTIEENNLPGGFGDGVLETLDAEGLSLNGVIRLGLPDGFVTHGTREELLKEVGLTAERVERDVLVALGR